MSLDKREEKKRMKENKKIDKMLRKMKKKEDKNKIVESARMIEARKIELNEGRSHDKVEPLKETKKDVHEVQEEKTEHHKKKKEKKISTQRVFISFLLVMIVVTGAFFFFTKNAVQSFILFSGAVLLFSFYLVMKKRLDYYSRIKKMEEVFPDFISLMSSNLRAGMTIDRALILSARKEFAPLDKEIMQLGKDILTGGEITQALKDMAKRIESDEIRKTVQILISGIQSGGNLAVLLENTANNMRERIFVRKRASSNVLMYVIFIFFAVAVGAPLLFGLSNVLVEIMSNIFANISVEDVSVSLPFTISQINISTTFVFYFSLIFIVVSSVLASLILGLVSKGKESDGTKYILPLVVIGITVFLVSRFVLLQYFSGIFG